MNNMKLIDSLYEELSERPHVATGKEAKLLRKLKAEHKMSEEEIRKNPDYRKMLAEAQKSETTYSKTKKKELHYLVKKIIIYERIRSRNDNKIQKFG